MSLHRGIYISPILSTDLSVPLWALLVLIRLSCVQNSSFPSRFDPSSELKLPLAAAVAAMAEEFILQSNSSNGTNCYGDYCVESTIYRKVMGTILFVAVWPFIVLDIKQFPLGRPAAALVGAVLMVLFVIVPQEQVYVILGERGNLQTLFLLIGMMLLSYYYDREGMLQYITLWIFGQNKPFRHVLWKVCVLSAVLSAIITNDATCLVLTPLFLAEHIKQERSKAEYPPLLLGIATSSNIGGVATFFGNPQNAFIAANSRGQVSLLIFFVTTLPAAIMGMGISIALLYLCYFRTVWPKRGDLPMDAATEQNGRAIEVPLCNAQDTTDYDTTEPPRNAVHLESMSLATSREELAHSYDRSHDPFSSSLLSQERCAFHTRAAAARSAAVMPQNGRRLKLGKYNKTQSVSETSYGGNSSSSQEYGATNHLYNHVVSGRILQGYTKSSNHDGSSMTVSELQQQVEGAMLERGPSLFPADTDDMEPEQTTSSTNNWRQKLFIGWLILITAILVILLAIPPPPAVKVKFNLGLVPVAAGVMTMLVDTLLNRKYAFDAMMKVDWTIILMFMGLFIWLTGFENTLFPANAFAFIRQYMDLYTIQGVLLFTLFVVVGSNILSNVPLVILIMDQLFNFECGGSNNYCSGQLTGMLLAWVSTVAGNFTLIGSVANLIVAEKGRNITNYRLSFFEYLKFGLCSTTLVLLAGLPIVYFAGENVDI